MAISNDIKQNVMKYLNNNVNSSSSNYTPKLYDNVIQVMDQAYEEKTTTYVTEDNQYMVTIGTMNSAFKILIFSINSIYENQSYIASYNIPNIGNYSVVDTGVNLERDEEGRFYTILHYQYNSNNKYYLVLFNNFLDDGIIQINAYYDLSKYTYKNNAGTTKTYEQFNIVKKQKGQANYVLFNNVDYSTTLNSDGYLYVGMLKVNTIGANTTKNWKVNLYTRSGGTYEYYKMMSTTIIAETDNIYILTNVEYRFTTQQYDDYMSGIERIELLNDNQNKDANEVYIGKVTELYGTAQSCIMNSKFYLYSQYYMQMIEGDYNSTQNKTQFYYIQCDIYGNSRKTKIEGELYDGYMSSTIGVIDNSSFNKQYLIYNFTMISTGFPEYSKLIKINNTDGSITNILDFTDMYDRTSDLNMTMIEQFNLKFFVIFNNQMEYIPQMFILIDVPEYGGNSYISKNFLIPQYLELYQPIENLIPKMLRLNRSVSDRQLIGNQITSTFNIPYTYLNDNNVNVAELMGQTNKVIASDNWFNKNIYENIYFNEIMNINIIDNTNGLYKYNQDASNKFANSIWNKLDEDAKRLFKIRYNKIDGTSEIVNIGTITYNSTNNTLSFNYRINQDGTIYSADFLSYDETTTYASFVIPLEEKIYVITQGVHLETQEKYEGV